MDWTTQPPSSAQFQQGLAEYKESFTNPVPQPTQNIYKEIDGSNMTPPDTAAAEQKEKEILATYVPKKPGELTTYDVDDAKEIIRRVYDAKGLVPDYKQTGTNTFTVMSTRKKNEPIVYEDDVGPTHATAQASPNASAGEGTIVVPSVAMDYNAGLDPFFTAEQSGKTRDAKWDYTRWTPGLERMFAPTAPQTNWF